MSQAMPTITPAARGTSRRVKVRQWLTCTRATRRQTPDGAVPCPDGNNVGEVDQQGEAPAQGQQHDCPQGHPWCQGKHHPQYHEDGQNTENDGTASSKGMLQDLGEIDADGGATARRLCPRTSLGLSHRESRSSWGRAEVELRSSWGRAGRARAGWGSPR